MKRALFSPLMAMMALATDHILTEWGGYMKGKPAGTEKFDLHREKKA